MRLRVWRRAGCRLAAS